MKRVLVLVEGQTEETFVNETLVPYLSDFNVFLSPTIIMTKKVYNGPNHKGGMSNFAKFERDIKRLLHDPTAIVTSFIDFYALPTDFPGMNNLTENQTSQQKVLYLERELENHFRAPNFVPYIQLHEFEALLYSDECGFENCLEHDECDIGNLKQVIAEFDNPEEINNRPETAPSKRILNSYPAYDKVFEGNLVAEEIGIKKMLKKCPHFRDWVEKLQN